MNNYRNIPGLKGVNIERIVEQQERIILNISLPKQEHTCPACGQTTSKVHDYRMQKITHLKWFDRATILFYKRRRYVCTCGKRFSENASFIDRYQRCSNEYNQVEGIGSVTASTPEKTRSRNSN